MIKFYICQESLSAFHYSFLFSNLQGFKNITEWRS